MKKTLSALVCAIIILAAGQAMAEQSSGQTIYVPAYSHIYYGDKPNKFLLTTTLSIRNTDPARPLTVLKAEYRDSDGKVLRSFVDAPQVLGPLAATRFVVAESDKDGGSGACFIVHWQAAEKINPPVVQAVMIGAAANQGISFIGEGRPIVWPK